MSEGMSDEQLMTLAVHLLYERSDPRAATIPLRKILEHSPTHYGAVFQLALAYERAGEKQEAVHYWKESLAMATRIGDAETAAAARSHIAALER